MSLTALTGLVNTIATTTLALLVFLRNPSGKTHRAYLFFGLSVGLYSIGYFFWGMSRTVHDALFAFKVLTTGIILINSGYLEFAFNLLEVREQKRLFLFALHILNALFVILVWKEVLFADVSRRNVWGYWPYPKFSFFVYFLIWAWQMGYGLLAIGRGYLRATSWRAIQLRYVFYSTLIGYIGGGTNWLPWFGIDFPPYLNILVSVYIAVLAYAIVRYRLMEIHIAITRTGIFIFVYCLVLGIPAALILQGKFVLENWLGQNWWTLPAGLFSLLSFTGPFIYLTIQRRAEAVLLREQKAYQQTLLQASKGMTLIKDLDKLLKLMVHILTKTIRITHASIFLWDGENSQFVCKAARGDHRKQERDIVLEDTALVREIRKTKEPLIFEEVRAQDPSSVKLSYEAIREMEALDAAVIVPSFVQDRLLGFLVLGGKKSRRPYTGSDLDTLATLANQAALAIENCVFLTSYEQQQAHLFQAAKMADLGTMASGIGHQVNNRFNITKLGSEVLMMSSIPRLKKYLKEGNPEGVDGVMKDIEKALKTINDNAAHGGEIVARLLDFSRLSEGFKPVDVTEAVENCIRLWECKHDLTKIDFKLEIADGIPKVYGNLSEIEEILFNLLDNAYDAFRMKEEAWELGHLERPPVPLKSAVRLSVRETVRRNKRYVAFTIADNGLGMPEKVQQQLFVPFFTTKATAVKGTGLGLYIIRRMVDAHHGEIFMESEYGKGTTFRVLIPASEG